MCLNIDQVNLDSYNRNISQLDTNIPGIQAKKFT
jgi:hypothetical protein